MAVRAGMTNLLLRLREFCNAGLTDYTVNGVAYFTDQQLQDELDHVQTTWFDVLLLPVPRRTAPNTTSWLVYPFPDRIGDWFEEDDGTGSYWLLKDETATAISSSAYDVSYLANTITLHVDALGKARWLDCRTYDLFSAAAAIWRVRADLEMRSIDWSSNGSVMHSSQRRDYCFKMAEYYSRKAGMQTGLQVRTDEL